MSFSLLVAHVVGAGAIWKSVSRHIKKFDLELAERRGGEEKDGRRATRVSTSADGMTYSRITRPGPLHCRISQTPLSWPTILALPYSDPSIVVAGSEGNGVPCN